jgi:hypothetical protein
VRAPHALRIPASELHRADKRQDNGNDTDASWQVRDVEQGQLGSQHHQEGKRPHRSDGVVGADELGAAPELGRGSNQGNIQNEKSLYHQSSIDFRCYLGMALSEPRQDDHGLTDRHDPAPLSYRTTRSNFRASH